MAHRVGVRLRIMRNQVRACFESDRRPSAGRGFVRIRSAPDRPRPPGTLRPGGVVLLVSGPDPRSPF